MLHLYLKITAILRICELYCDISEAVKNVQKTKGFFLNERISILNKVNNNIYQSIRSKIKHKLSAILEKNVCFQKLRNINKILNENFDNDLDVGRTVCYV